MAPLGNAIGRVIARDDVLFVDLLGQPAQGAHPVLERDRADLFRMPALDQVLDMLRAHAGRSQVSESVFVELVRDQGLDALSIMLRGERAIAVALAQILEVVVEVGCRISVPLRSASKSSGASANAVTSAVINTGLKRSSEPRRIIAWLKLSPSNRIRLMPHGHNRSSRIRHARQGFVATQGLHDDD